MASSSRSNTPSKNKPSNPSSQPPASAPVAAPETKKSSIPPTPQNTPVNPAPIGNLAAFSNRFAPADTSAFAKLATSATTAPSTKPTMGKNKGSPRKGHHAAADDDDDFDENDVIDVNELLSKNPEFSKNPELARAIKAKLGNLVGLDVHQPHTPEVKRRLKALKNLHHTHAELEAEFRQELLTLERKFLEKYQPLYEKRAKIVSGEVEPTDAECEREDSDLEEGLQGATIQEIDDDNKPVAPVKGIPNFWLTAMRNHPLLSTLITEADEAALAHLTNITLGYTDDNLGYVLNFVFEDNEFFTNKMLTKTYYLQNNVGASFEDLIYTKSEGCTIDWKASKNLTVRIETKKQRHKGSKKTRVVKREVPTDSFFRFFAPPKMPMRESKGDEEIKEDEDEEDEEDPELEDAIEQDFELGEVFKTRIVKHAVDWFTGKALEDYEDDDGYNGEDDDYDMDDEDGEGEDDDDDDDDDAPPAYASAKPGEKAECQQQ